MWQGTEDLKILRNMAIGAGVAILLLHFYFFCHAAFAAWNLVHPVVDRIIGNLVRTGIFRSRLISLLLSLGCGVVAIVCNGGRAGSGLLNKGRFAVTVILVIGLYFLGGLVLQNPGSFSVAGALYIFLAILNIFLALKVINTILAPVGIWFAGDVFNSGNECFPQMEKKLTNPFSFNLRARYTFRNQTRYSWINNINPMRGTAIWGSPGSGKTRYIIRPYIMQSLEKGYSMLIYDFKFPSLTKIAYNDFLHCRKKFPVEPTFHIVDFDHLDLSDQCDCIEAGEMSDISEAEEAARTLLLALNRDWRTKQGDFFQESAISFVTAAMWFLKKVAEGKYCTLPHLIELIQLDYQRLLSVLQSFPETETKIKSFVDLYLNGTFEVLDSQVASARISLSAMASPRLYYGLSGKNLSLEINDPGSPKIICLGSNPQKQKTYGAALSLLVTRMIRMINKPGRTPCHFIFDEVSTIAILGLPDIMGTGRENKIAVTYAAQSMALLKAAYGRDLAETLFHSPGNVFFGQAVGDTAKMMSESIGKIIQPRRSFNENRNGSSTGRSEHLDMAVPPSKIAALSAGEFVGYVADNPAQKIKLKAFHCEIINDHETIRQDKAGYKDLPPVRPEPAVEDLERNFERIKREVDALVQAQLTRMAQTPALSGKVITNTNAPVSARQRTRKTH